MRAVRIFFLTLLIGVPAYAQDPASLGGMSTAPDAHLEYWIRTLQAHPLKLVRKNAARTLGKMGTHDAVPALLGALKEPDPGVRAEAAKSLGSLTDERAFGPLHDALSNDSDREVRKAASNSIEIIKSFLENQKQKDEKTQSSELKAP